MISQVFLKSSTRYERTSKEKDGRSPFEKEMRRQPNTVTSNLVSKLLDISEQCPNLEFGQFDFQDDLDSTVLCQGTRTRLKVARNIRLAGGRRKKNCAYVEYVTGILSQTQDACKKGYRHCNQRTERSVWTSTE